MKTVRGKFTATVTKNEDGSMNIGMNAVASGSEENKAFSDATPSGSISMQIAKDKPSQELFETGKSYFVDFTVAEEEVAAETVTPAPDAEATTQDEASASHE